MTLVHAPARALEEGGCHFVIRGPAVILYFGMSDRLGLKPGQDVG